MAEFVVNVEIGKDFYVAADNYEEAKEQALQAARRYFDNMTINYFCVADIEEVKG